jgi:hypothetical protein
VFLLRTRHVKNSKGSSLLGSAMSIKSPMPHIYESNHLWEVLGEADASGALAGGPPSNGTFCEDYL